MNPSTRTVEITVISAEDLRIKRHPIKSNAFAAVKTDDVVDNISSDNIALTTKIDQVNGSYPYWNEKLLMDLPLGARFITVEVRRRRSNLSDEGQRTQLVGTARIPVSDFVGGYVPEGYLHFLSYRLRDEVGERNGVVNVWVRVITRSPTTYGCSTSSSHKSEMGFPVGARSGGGGGTAVTGFPVWYAMHAGLN